MNFISSIIVTTKYMDMKFKLSISNSVTYILCKEVNKDLMK
jgi:hypothetical protein